MDYINITGFENLYTDSDLDEFPYFDHNINDVVHLKKYVNNSADMLKPWISNPAFFPIITTHAITFLIGLAGNIVVIVTMTRESDRASRSVTSMFLVSLAVADILLLLICTPLETLGYFVNTWARRGSLCKLQAYVEMLSAVASVLNLTAVSLERYIVIVYPMRSRSFCTLRNCRRALFAVWAIALILTWPVVLTRDRFTYVYYDNTTSVAVHYCLDVNDSPGKENGTSPGFLVAIYQLLIMFFLPLILMAVCYSRVIQELWLSTIQIAAMTRNYSNSSSSTISQSGKLNHAQQSIAASDGNPGFISHINSRPSNSSSRTSVSSSWTTSTAISTLTAAPYSETDPPSTSTKLVQPPTTTSRFTSKHSQRSSDEAKQARKQVIKMLILVVILFLVCWGPRLILNALIKWGLSSYSQTFYNLRVIFNILPFVHSCLNPIIYGFMSSNFRRMMIRSCARRRNSFSRTCQSCRQTEADRPHSGFYNMGSRVGLKRQTSSAYCLSTGTTEALTLPTTPSITPIAESQQETF